MNSSKKVKGFSTNFNRLMYLNILDSLVYTIGVSGESDFQNKLKTKQAKKVSKQMENEKDLKSHREETSPLSKLFYTKHIKNSDTSLKPLHSLNSAFLNNDFLKMNLTQPSSNPTINDVPKLNVENQLENDSKVSKSSEKLIPTEQSILVAPVKDDVQLVTPSTFQKEVKETDVQLSQESQQNVKSPSIIRPLLMNDEHVSLQTPVTNVQQHEHDNNNLTGDIQQSQFQNILDPEIEKTDIDIQNKFEMEPPKERLTDDLINSMLVPLTEQQRLPLSVETHNLDYQQQQELKYNVLSAVKSPEQGQQFQSNIGNNTDNTHGMVQQIQSDIYTTNVQVEQADNSGVNVPLRMLNQQAIIHPPTVSQQQQATVQLPNVNVKKSRKQQLNVHSPRQIIIQTTTATPYSNSQSSNIKISQKPTIIRTTTMPNVNVQSPIGNVSPTKINVQTTTDITTQQPQTNVQSSSVQNFPQQLDNTVPRRRIDPKSFPNVQAALLGLSRPINSSKTLPTAKWPK